VSSDNPCGGCGVTRRDFLHQLGAGAALAVIPLPLLATAGSERSYPVPTADGVHVDSDGMVIVARWDGQVAAMSLACTHQRTPLRWRETDGQFLCPKHESRFAVDGTLIRGRAERSLDRHPVRREADRLIVNTATLIRADRDAAAWRSAALRA
jgi:nitrite reductase/ring-hydroxylating ferredoxin subunit